jgi:hypothetical protein
MIVDDRLYQLGFSVEIINGTVGSATLNVTIVTLLQVVKITNINGAERPYGITIFRDSN